MASPGPRYLISEDGIRSRSVAVTVSPNSAEPSESSSRMRSPGSAPVSPILTLDPAKPKPPIRRATETPQRQAVEQERVVVQEFTVPAEDRDPGGPDVVYRRSALRSRSQARLGHTRTRPAPPPPVLGSTECVSIWTEPSGSRKCVRSETTTLPSARSAPPLIAAKRYSSAPSMRPIERSGSTDRLTSVGWSWLNDLRDGTMGGRSQGDDRGDNGVDCELHRTNTSEGTMEAGETTAMVVHWSTLGQPRVGSKTTGRRPMIALLAARPFDRAIRGQRARTVWCSGSGGPGAGCSVPQRHRPGRRGSPTKGEHSQRHDRAATGFLPHNRFSARRQMPARQST